MANLSYGSSGADVLALQEQLRAAGYNIAADGIFGPATQSAVRAYQQANGLQVDGIVGNQTRSALSGTTVAPVSSGTGITTQTAAAFTPAAYSSPYQSQLDALYNQITSRQPFRYDLGGDSLYRQYSQQYQRLGQRAMQDTVGQTAALTGGYGSTYGQSAGQQAYNKYLAQLNNVVPELEQRAYNRYADEGNALLDRYNLLNDREQTAYQQYRDRVADEYQRYRDQVADSQWERQFAANQAAAAARAATVNDTAIDTDKYVKAQPVMVSDNPNAGKGTGYTVMTFSDLKRTLRGYEYTGQTDKALALASNVAYYSGNTLNTKQKEELQDMGYDMGLPDNWKENRAQRQAATFKKALLSK